MARFGYTRYFQDVPERQADLERLEVARCDIVRTEIGGGRARGPNRHPVLDSILELIGPGDVLVAARPASLSGIGAHLMSVLDLVTARGAAFEFCEPSVSSRSQSGRLFLEALRVSLSLSFKPPIVSEIEALLAEGHGPTKIATRLGISRQSVYRYIWKRGVNRTPRERQAAQRRRSGLAERTPRTQEMRASEGATPCEAGEANR